MKQIKIQHFTTPENDSIYTNRRKYHVAIGNGYIGYFGNQKDVTAFLTETNVFLNEKLHELNFIYINLFSNELPRCRASRYRVTRKINAIGFC